MTKSISAGNSPVILILNKGELKSWCACGRSLNQPWCDGAHRAEPVNSEVRSVKFTLDEDRTVALCLCKKTSNPPFCDGTHNQMS